MHLCVVLWLCVYVGVYVCICMYVYVYVCIWGWMCVCVCVYMIVCICVCARVSMCMGVYMRGNIQGPQIKSSHSAVFLKLFSAAAHICEHNNCAAHIILNGSVFCVLRNSVIAAKYCGCNIAIFASTLCKFYLAY